VKTEPVRHLTSRSGFVMLDATGQRKDIEPENQRHEFTE
jgi:hypothetical protein